MDDIIEVLITVDFTIDQIAQIEKASPRFHIISIPTQDVTDIPDEIWAKIHILYTTNVLPSIEQAPNLHWIQFHWAGVNTLLDAPILKKPGLIATSLSGTSASQVAEYAVMMLLALGHRLSDAISLQSRSEWPADRWERFHPAELRGSTVGIIGYGSIGRQIAYLLHPFGASILAAKHDAMHTEDQGYMPENMGDPNADLVRRLYPGKALCSMLKECDFIVVCTPKTPETIKLIGEKELAVCKPTAFLVDISRGQVVDHVALIAALREHKLAGAALDVFPEEPLPADSPLWKLPNIFITPHIAGNTRYFKERALPLFLLNLERYMASEPFLNIISLSKGY